MSRNINNFFFTFHRKKQINTYIQCQFAIANLTHMQSFIKIYFLEKVRCPIISCVFNIQQILVKFATPNSTSYTKHFLFAWKNCKSVTLSKRSIHYRLLFPFCSDHNNTHTNTNSQTNKSYWQCLSWMTYTDGNIMLTRLINKSATHFT